MKFEKAVTEHGVPLYVFSMPHVASVATGVLIHAGTRDEDWPSEAGLAHAFEHMVFKENSRLKNSEAISGEIEDRGGVVNAWTDKEMTFYHRIVPYHDFETGVRSISSQLESSLFRDEDIKKEMKSIAEEIRMYSDNPIALCVRAIDSVVYGNHPLGKDTLGSIESVTSFGQDDFLYWQKHFCCLNNYVFLAVGNVTLDDAIEVFNRTSFGPNTGTRNKRKSIFEINQDNKVKVIERDIKQTNVCLGTAIGSASDDETKALDLYTAMIGGGMSFPLFQEVRDKRGLCYHVKASLEPWSDRGIFTVYVGTERPREAIDCIKNVIWDNRANENLFDKAKRFVIGENDIKFCDPVQILMRAAMETIFSGSPKSPEEINEEVRSIKLSTVTSAVKRYLHPDNLSYVYVVPKGTKIN